MKKFTEDQLRDIKIAKSISKFLGERSHVNQMLYLLSIHEYTISWQPLMKLIKKFDELNLDCPFYQEACDRIDNAVTTYDINKAFAEVAKAIQWYDLAYMCDAQGASKEEALPSENDLDEPEVQPKDEAVVASHSCTDGNSIEQGAWGTVKVRYIDNLEDVKAQLVKINIRHFFQCYDKNGEKWDMLLEAPIENFAPLLNSDKKAKVSDTTEVHSSKTADNQITPTT